MILLFGLTLGMEVHTTSLYHPGEFNLDLLPMRIRPYIFRDNPRPRRDVHLPIPPASVFTINGLTASPNPLLHPISSVAVAATELEFRNINTTSTLTHTTTAATAVRQLLIAASTLIPNPESEDIEQLTSDLEPVRENVEYHREQFMAEGALTKQLKEELKATTLFISRLKTGRRAFETRNEKYEGQIAGLKKIIADRNIELGGINSKHNIQIQA